METTDVIKKPGKTRKNWFIFAFKVIKTLLLRPTILKAPGAHFIAGFPGSGKTLMMNSIINSYDSSKYFFLSNLDEFNHDNVYSFKLHEVFGSQTQLRSFPLVDHLGRQLAGIIFDEINLSFNRRINRQKNYNELFLGLIEFLVSHRHQGVPCVWFIGQKLALQDSQLQLLFKYYHDIVRTKRKPSYKFYKEIDGGPIIWVPRKLCYNNYCKNFNDEFMQINKRVCKKKISYYDLETYNTKALGENYAKLPTVHWGFSQAYIDKKIKNEL